MNISALSLDQGNEELLSRQRSNITRLVVYVAHELKKRGFGFPQVNSRVDGVTFPIIPIIKRGLPPGTPAPIENVIGVLYHRPEQAIYFDPGQTPLEENNVWTTDNAELMSLISEALGAHFIAERAVRYPQSWLAKQHPENGSNAFAAAMIRAGIIHYFGRIFGGTNEHFQESAWERDSGKSELADKNSRLRSRYIKCGGYEIVGLLLNIARSSAIDYLFCNKLDLGDFCLTNALEYQKNAFRTLSCQKYGGA